MLKGIDISHYQGDAGLTSLASLSGVEFVICKATEGLTYVDPWCDKFVQQAINLNLPWGFYHFGRNNDAEQEAQTFIDNCYNYFGCGIPVLDWEADQSVSWVNTFVNYIKNKTGIWPWIYANPWRFNQGGVESNCMRWIAKYPNVKNPSLDYDPGTVPETDGLVGCWQYASDGRVSGYSGDLDLNHFYGDTSAWYAYVGNTTLSGQTVDNSSSTVNNSSSNVSTLENDEYKITIEEK